MQNRNPNFGRLLVLSGFVVGSCSHPLLSSHRKSSVIVLTKFGGDITFLLWQVDACSL